MEHERLITDLNGMAGIVTTLVAGDYVEALGEQINDLAFAFVSPLSTDNNYYLRHDLLRSLNSIERWPLLSFVLRALCLELCISLLMPAEHWIKRRTSRFLANKVQSTKFKDQKL